VCEIHVLPIEGDKPLSKTVTMFFASVKKFGLYNSYGKKCSKVIMNKLIV
jgi:hypothetical protein